MILDSNKPIDLPLILGVMSLYAELSYVDIPAGVSAFDHPKAMSAIDEATRAFPGTVEDREDQEEQIRRGLCWLLHQDDDVLRGIYQTGQHNLPLASPSMSDQRRLLDLLWGSAFADWKSRTFDPESYPVVDSNPGTGVPVALDSVVPIDFAVIFGLLRPPVAADPEEAYRVLVEEPERENDARLGLGWLLHQDDESLGGLLARGETVVASVDISDRRRQLQALWDRLFADWRDDGFDQAAYQVMGLPG